MFTYPRYQYARIDGETKSRVITHPDHEEPEVWKESPAHLPALPPVEPELPGCCQKLKAKFDAAWQELKAEHATQAAVIAGFDAHWDLKVKECAALEAQLEALKPAKKAPKAKAE